MFEFSLLLLHIDIAPFFFEVICLFGLFCGCVGCLDCVGCDCDIFYSGMGPSFSTRQLGGELDRGNCLVRD